MEVRKQIRRECNFGVYCNDCRHFEKSEHEDPCCKCLAEPTNKYTSKPVMFSEKK